MINELLILVGVTLLAIFIVQIVKFVQSNRKPLDMAKASTLSNIVSQYNQKDLSLWWTSTRTLDNALKKLSNDSLLDKETSLIDALTDSNFQVFKYIVSNKNAQAILKNMAQKTQTKLFIHLLIESTTDNFQKLNHYLDLEDTILINTQLSQSLMRAVCLCYQTSGKRTTENDNWLASLNNNITFLAVRGYASEYLHMGHIADICTPKTFWAVIGENNFFREDIRNQKHNPTTTRCGDKLNLDDLIQKNICAVLRKDNPALTQDVIKKCQNRNITPSHQTMMTMHHKGLINHLKDFFTSDASYKAYLANMKTVTENINNTPTSTNETGKAPTSPAP